MSIYLDYNATTPVDERVLERMLPYFSEKFGNAASKTHSFGWEADEAVKRSREQVAAFLKSDESEIVFTSGATEAINLSIKGVAEAYANKGKHIVTISSEHKAVLDTCRHLERSGMEITILPVLHDGMVDTDLIKKSIRNDTILVCVMLANNETGVLQPIDSIADIVHEKGSLLFSDATQAAGKIRIDVNELKADLLCISAHKMYGPKGTGALFIRRKNPRVRIVSQIDGGGHEKNLRSGTLNVPGIVGLGEACVIAADNLWEDTSRMSLLRTVLEQEMTLSGKVSINGNIKNRLPNTTNLLFHGLKAEELLHKANELALATGSACSSELPEPSHVLMAMGLSTAEAFSSIRFSLGKYTTEQEIRQAIEVIKKAGIFKD
jgi:cysteine desulfurase